MRFLLDMPVSFLLLDVLQAHGHEGVHAHQIGKDRAPDEELLEMARRGSRVIITADLDFPRLMALSLAEGPGLILFRGGNYSDSEMCDLLARVLQKVPAEVLERSVCVVDRRRVRVWKSACKRDPRRGVEIGIENGPTAVISVG
jgi:predicted nuclease of predicted toxin-antitoxin system